MGKKYMNEENKIDCRYTKCPVCPYCGEEFEDWHDLDIKSDSDVEIECPGCEKEYIFVGQQGDWYFNSFKKD